MRANVFGQIPLLDSACLIARYQFPLVGVNTNIIDWRLVVIIAMKVRIPEVPYLYSPVFTSRH